MTPTWLVRRGRVARLLVMVTLTLAVSTVTVAAARAAGARPLQVGATPHDSTPYDSTPYDYGLLRLWLPRGWTTSTSCHNRSHVVYYPATFVGGPTCTAEPITESVTVEPFEGTPPQRAEPIRRNGVTI